MKSLSLSLFVSLLIFLSFSEAQADWQLQSGAEGESDMLVDISSPDGDSVFALGFSLNPNDISQVIIPLIFASHDGGITMENISGTLDDVGGTEAPVAIHFLNENAGWVSVGTKVYRTPNRGVIWAEVDVGVTAQAFHFFDTSNGFLVAAEGKIMKTSDSGQSWTNVASPTTTDLHHMVWLDKSRGFILGHTSRKENGGDNGLYYDENGVVLITTDSGQTWTQGFTFEGKEGTALAFTPDGTKGFLGLAFREDPEDFFDRKMELWRTDDGGLSFTQIAIPLEVGTFEPPFGSNMAIESSSILAMAFENDGRGRLGAIAYVMELEETSYNSEDNVQFSRLVPVMRIINYYTEDFGASFTYNQLGTLSSSLENMQITSPDSDGDLKKGVMVGLNVGYLAADQRRIWGYDFTCSQDSECGTDFVCGVGGLCIYSPPASDNPDGQSDDDPSTTPYDPEDEGCGCTTAEPVWFMMLFGFFGMRRRIK